MFELYDKLMFSFAQTFFYDKKFKTAADITSH